MLQIILNFIKRQESNENSLNIFFSRFLGKCFEFRSELEFFTPIDVKRFLAAEVELEEVEKIEEDSAIERVVHDRRVTNSQVAVTVSANSLVCGDALHQNEVQLSDEKQRDPDEMQASVEKLPRDESGASESFENRAPLREARNAHIQNYTVLTLLLDIAAMLGAPVERDRVEMPR